MSANKRSKKDERQLNVKNIVQPVGYQSVTQSVAATGRFKSRHFVIMAVIAYLMTEVIKFVVNSIIFRGDSSPTGIGFTIVFYIQVVLLLAAFLFLVAAIIQALRNLLKES